jgi:hypothetical protein
VRDIYPNTPHFATLIVVEAFLLMAAHSGESDQLFRAMAIACSGMAIT